MNCRVGRGFAVCSADAMWDDPSSRGLAEFLHEIADREFREHECELDLQRQAELYPEVEVEEPDIVPSELLLAWDAYRDDS